MRVDVLTLFPDAFHGPLDVSIIKRAREAGLLDLHLHAIREHATDKHRTVDDYPFGGGQGMVMRVDVLAPALEHVQSLDGTPGYVIYLSPQGELLNDALVRGLAQHERLVLVAGRYEGVDERFVEHCVDREVSIGDYILTGGELPAMVLIDAVARHIPGALGDETSPEEESFVDGLLEHPQYTRPAEYRGWAVPDVLLSGHHANIEKWKHEQREARTRERRQDLLRDHHHPTLASIAEAEDEYVQQRFPSLGTAFSMLKARWFDAGARDEETAARLFFLAWYTTMEPWWLTGLPKDEDTSLILRSVFAEMGAERSQSDVFLFVAGKLLRFDPDPATTTDDAVEKKQWQSKASKCLARVKKRRPEGFKPSAFAGRGEMGHYLEHMLHEDGWTFG